MEIRTATAADLAQIAQIEAVCFPAAEAATPESFAQRLQYYPNHFWVLLACEAVKKSKKLLKFTLDDGTGVERTILSGIHEYYEPEELVGKTCVAITNLPPRPMMGIESCGMLISAVHHEEGEEKLHLLMLDNHIPAGAKMY